MNLRSLPEYKNLEKELDRCIKLNVNFLIVTFVGYSVSFFLKKILEKKKGDITYINQEGLKLSKYNILDLDFSSNPNALEIVEKYIKSAKLDQKFAVVINTPYVLETDEFKRSYIGTHFYSLYKFKKPSFEKTKLFAKRMGISLSIINLEKLHSFSGGIGRLCKYILVNIRLLDSDTKELINYSNLKKLIEPIVGVYLKSDESLLEEYGVKENGIYTSELINSYIESHPVQNKLKISVTPDLLLVENNIDSDRLINIEAKIIKYTALNNGLIEKEKIAEFKWGENSYDKYSDQAIVKTIRRLNKKMKYYKFSTISKVGYKLIQK